MPTLGSALQQKLKQLGQSFGSRISGIFSSSEAARAAVGGAVSPLGVASARTYEAEVVPPVTTGTEWEEPAPPAGRRLLQARGAPPTAQESQFVNP